MVIPPNSDITSSTSLHSRHKATSSGGQTPKESPQTQPATNYSDNVQLSQEAQALKQLESRMASADDTDSAKVEQIRQQIADGSYEINSADIADGLLKHESWLNP